MLKADSTPELGASADHSVLSYRDYRLFLGASFFSTLAIQAQSVAVAWQIYAITHSPLALGYAGLFPFLPIMFFLLPAGSLADRVDRRMVLAICYAVQGLVSGLFLLLTVRNVSVVWPFYAVLLLFGTGRAFSAPSRQSFLPLLVPQNRFAQAVTWNTAAFQIATILGPALGGVLYVLGPSIVYAACLVTMIAVAIATVAMRTRSQPHPTSGDASPFQRLTAGIVYVRGNPLLLGGMVLDLFAVLLGGATALLPVYARDILHIGPTGLGILRSAPALGAATLAVILGHVPLSHRSGRKMFVCVALFGLATIVFGVSRNFVLSLAALVVLGAADMVSMYVRDTIAQLATPDEMRGRVSAVNGMFISGSNQLGEFESGLTASWFGTVPAVVIGGVGTILVVTAGWWLFPALREVEDPSQVTPATAYQS